MTLLFAPVVLPDDAEAAIEFLTVNEWPYHGRPRLDAAHAAQVALAGDDVASFWIRDDGRMVHDMYLMQVKAPSESKEPWDYYKVVAKLPGEEVFTTKAESKCALWK